MPISNSGAWYPHISQKQLEVFNSTSRFVLCSGPRKSAKTRAVQHRVMRHAWEAAQRTRIGVIVKTIKSAKIGSFDTLYHVVAKEWEENLAGFRITKPLCQDASTKMNFFRVSNSFGGESEIQLHSLENISEAESKLKGTEFSMLWISEITNWYDRSVFDLSIAQLRMPGVSYDDHQFIADCNPSEEEGDQHFAYKIWYEERLEKDHPHQNFQKQLDLIEFKIDDNPFLDPREVEDLKASYRNDPALYDVYINGIWRNTSHDSIFAGVFSPGRHVIAGDEELTPEDNTTELFVGWDPGDVNLSVHIMEKVTTPVGIMWKVLDEVCEIGNNTVTLGEFALAVCDVMDEWEERCDKKFRWIHYSDSQAIDCFRSSSGTYGQLEIYQATEGRVRVEGVPKFSGSQRLRVKLVRELLNEGKMFISGRCPKLIASLSGGLKRDKRRLRYIRDGIHKHPFDSCSYVIQAEGAYDLMTFDGAPKTETNFSSRL